MKRPPAIYSAVCPHCGAESSINLLDAGAFWLADTLWRCPWCWNKIRTRDMKDVPEENKEVKDG